MATFVVYNSYMNLDDVVLVIFYVIFFDILRQSEKHDCSVRKMNVNVWTAIQSAILKLF